MEEKKRTNTQKESSVYYLARKKAAKHNPILNSREKTSELLGVSAQSLQNYEDEKTKVPDDIIVKMANLYQSPELCHHYCHKICAIGRITVHEIDSDNLALDRLTLKLLNSFNDVAQIKDDLIAIAADGIIDDGEKDTFDNIVETLDSISKHASELKIWAQKEFANR